jgi:4'-phosphopantetheinyl transferase
VTPMRNLDLKPQQIDLWCAYPNYITDPALLQQYRKLLCETEQQQEQRFYFARDRHRYLVTRILVRSVLSRYAPVAPNEWRFDTNAYGKPHIANCEQLRKTIAFNVTHSDNLVILGVANEHALGLDTENARARIVSLELADAYFAPEEVTDLRAQSTERQQRRFFEYWTLKESYIKARGMGLSIPLDQFSFSFSHKQTIQLAIHSSQDDLPVHWDFWQFELNADYLVAVCAKRSDLQPPSLVPHHVVPLLSEQPLDWRLLRASRHAANS